MNLSDFPFFFAPLSGLTRLRLSGAGRGGPLPLLDLLGKCPGLEELTLDNCGVYVPPGIAADRLQQAVLRQDKTSEGCSIKSVLNENRKKVLNENLN